MNTKEAILSQLTECTGSHMCDSGGPAIGGHRAWQRNQGKSFEELATPDISVEAFVYTHSEPYKLELLSVVKLASYMDNNLTYRPDIQEAYEAFVEEQPEGYHMEHMQAFADLHESDSKVAYSYNWDSNLSQDIQFVTFEYEGDRVALIQSHNGADARGSLSSPLAYEIRGDHYLGDCLINSYYTKERYWDESGSSEDRTENLFDLPVYDFKYTSNLPQDLANLALTNMNTDEQQHKMLLQDAENEELAFEEFCDSLEDVSVVVHKRKAYYVDSYPEEIYAESYSLMG